MRVIIAGSRKLYGVELIDKVVKLSGFNVSELVSGKASGIDTSAEQWAKFRGIPIKDFFAKWDDLTKRDAIVKVNSRGKKYNARAGFRRNLKMADYADALIAIWDGNSPGTKDMIRSARKKELKIYVYRWDAPEQIAERPVRVIKGASRPTKGAPF